MKKRIKINFKVASFSILIFILAIIIYLNQDYLKVLMQSYIHEFEFLAIFILVFLTEILFQPIGPEVPALIGIFLKLNLMGIIGVTLFGSYLASLLNYFLSYGVAFKKSGEKEYHEKKYKRLIRQYGKWGVTVASLTPVPWVPFCWFAGSKLKLKDFIAYGLFPRTLRILIVIFGADYVFRFFGL